MAEKLEDFIKKVYRRWKAGQVRLPAGHPGEEGLVCFAQGRLSLREAEAVKLHLVTCDSCSRQFATYQKLDLLPEKELEVPQDLTGWLRDLVDKNLGNPALEIFLRFKEKILELVSTTGDVLVGQ